MVFQSKYHIFLAKRGGEGEGWKFGRFDNFVKVKVFHGSQSLPPSYSMLLIPKLPPRYSTFSFLNSSFSTVVVGELNCIVRLYYGAHNMHALWDQSQDKKSELKRLEKGFWLRNSGRSEWISLPNGCKHLCSEQKALFGLHSNNINKKQPNMKQDRSEIRDGRNPFINTLCKDP